MMVAGLEEGQAAEMKGGGSRAETESKLLRGSESNGPTVLPSWLGSTRGIHQRNYVIWNYYYEELILNANLKWVIVSLYLLCPYS